MIWNADESDPSSRAAVVSRVIEGIAAVCDDPRADMDQAEEVARAVAAYVERSPETVCLESPRLAVLTSRALRSVGRERLASRMLVFGTGLVRSSVWTTAGGARTLVLDFRRIAWRSGECHELALFAALTSLLEYIADAWDETSGRGVLGLSRLSEAAAALAAGKGPSRRRATLAQEIRSHCGGILDRIAASRGWAHRPALLDLDFGARAPRRGTARRAVGPRRVPPDTSAN
jgi:hypothetical protein